jgi:hypothetical protein
MLRPGVPAKKFYELQSFRTRVLGSLHFEEMKFERPISSQEKKPTVFLLVTLISLYRI